MKKIAFLHYAYPPNIAGVEIVLREHAQILNSFGYDVKVITGFGKEPNKKIKLIIDPLFQSVLSFNEALQEKIVKKGIMDKDFFLLAGKIEDRLEEYLKDRDVVIVHNMLTLVHNLPFIYAFKNYIQRHKEKKVIVWVHDQTYVDKETIEWNKSDVNLSKELKDLLLSTIPKAEYVLISEVFKKLFVQIMDIDPKHVHVIHNGLNIRMFLEINDTIWNIVEQEQILNKFPIILCPVYIMPRKNIEYCLYIIEKLKEKYPHLFFIVTGKPSRHRKANGYVEKIEEIIRKKGLSKNILFLSNYVKRALDDEEIHDLYDISDLVFYFSKSENFGMPILEASISKTPIFVSDLKVFHEISSDYVNFIDITRYSAIETATKISKFIDSTKTIQSQRYTRTSYNLQNILKKRLLPLFN